MILEADFHFSWIQPYHNDNIQNSEYFHMTLTFDLYLTLTVSLTFDHDDLKKLTFFKIFIFFEVTWRKNVTSYVKTEGRLQKRHSIRNILLPTGSLYHFRFKSYGLLCCFHKSGDLDLDIFPILANEG